MQQHLVSPWCRINKLVHIGRQTLVSHCSSPKLIHKQTQIIEKLDGTGHITRKVVANNAKNQCHDQGLLESSGQNTAETIWTIFANPAKVNWMGRDGSYSTQPASFKAQKVWAATQISPWCCRGTPKASTGFYSIKKLGTCSGEPTKTNIKFHTLHLILVTSGVPLVTRIMTIPLHWQLPITPNKRLLTWRPMNLLIFCLWSF